MVCFASGDMGGGGGGCGGVICMHARIQAGGRKHE